MGFADAFESPPADAVAARERWFLGAAIVAATAAVIGLGLVPGTTHAVSFAALAIAAASAFLCGALGLGFGAFLVPALLLLEVEPRLAVASSLIAQTAVVPLGSLSHASFGHVRARVVAPLVAAGIVGTFVGARFSLSMDDLVLAVLIGASTVLMGILVLIRGLIERGAHPREEAAISWQALAGIGLAAGFAAAAFGTGWGPVGVSLLILAGLLPKLAIGSSVTARAPIALSAAFAYVVLAGPQRVLELPVLLPVVAGGVFGILTGSVVTRRLGNGRLRHVVGLAIIALGLVVFLKV